MAGCTTCGARVIKNGVSIPDLGPKEIILIGDVIYKLKNEYSEQDS